MPLRKPALEKLLSSTYETEYTASLLKELSNDRRFADTIRCILPSGFHKALKQSNKATKSKKRKSTSICAQKTTITDMFSGTHTKHKPHKKAACKKNTPTL